MDLDDNISNLKTLKEMLLDEEKIVTYISVSKDLCVHINRSKFLLKQLLETLRKEDSKLPLNANYLISGLTEDGKAKVSVCCEGELENIRKSFKVLYFEHLYSICKGQPNTDPAAFVAINKYNDFNLCTGIIKNNNCIKRSYEEINNLKHSSQESAVDKLPILSQKKINKLPESKTNNLNNVNFKPKSDTVPEKPIKKEAVSPQKENINKQTNNKTGPQKGIAGFFNKQSNDSQKKQVKTTENTKPKENKTPKEEKVEKMDTEDIEVEIKVKTEVKKENGVDENNKMLNHIKKNSKVEKKRKRVLHVSDSESDAENDPFNGSETIENSHESDDEIPPTPAANNLKITTGIVNPKKKRKVVDKTYMSDDGYIITKREEVYESCSDTENNEVHKTDKEPPKKVIKQEKIEISPKSKISETKVSKKKISPPQKGKQSSIMNFFKKN